MREGGKTERRAQGSRPGHERERLLIVWLPKHVGRVRDLEMFRCRDETSVSWWKEVEFNAVARSVRDWAGGEPETGWVSADSRTVLPRSCSPTSSHHGVCDSKIQQDKERGMPRRV